MHMSNFIAPQMSLLPPLRCGDHIFKIAPAILPRRARCGSTIFLCARLRSAGRFLLHRSFVLTMKQKEHTPAPVGMCSACLFL